MKTIITSGPVSLYSAIYQSTLLPVFLFFYFLFIYFFFVAIARPVKPAKLSAFHWSTSRSQAFIGQLLGTSRVVHLPKRTVLVLFTISDA